MMNVGRGVLKFALRTSCTFYGRRRSLLLSGGTASLGCSNDLLRYFTSSRWGGSAALGTMLLHWQKLGPLEPDTASNLILGPYFRYTAKVCKDVHKDCALMYPASLALQLGAAKIFCRKFPNRANSPIRCERIADTVLAVRWVLCSGQIDAAASITLYTLHFIL